MNLKKFYLFFCIVNIFIFSSILNAEIVSEIKIKGNKRISTEYILSILSSKKGEDFTQIKSSDDIRSLYNTDLFSNVKINFKNKLLEINVTENPLIYDIVFVGNNEIKKDLLTKEIFSRKKTTFTENKINSDIQKIVNMYIQRGYLNSKVSYSKKITNDNMVSLVINIIEGNKTSIGFIKFYGNKYFSKSILEKIIYSKKHSLYSFLSNSDIYDKNKLLYDGELLRKFYLENGFTDFTLVSSNTNFSPIYGDFRITYIINEGERYKFGKQSVYIKVPEVEHFENKLNDIIQLKKEKWFAASFVEDQTNKIKKFIREKGFQFIEISPVYTYNNILKTVDISFVITNAQRTFINRIDIYGNTKTLDKVIRQELTLKEGDPFTDEGQADSTRHLYRSGFFSSVNLEKQPTKNKNETNLAVNVVESSTATIQASGGYNNLEKLQLGVSYNERNFLGRGIQSGIDLNFSQLSNNYSFSVGDPHFLDSNIYVGGSIYRKEQGKASLLGNTLKINNDLLYSSNEQGVGISLGYYITDYLRHNISYNLFSRKIYNINSTASLSIKELSGTKLISSITNTLSFDNTDNPYYITSGWNITLAEELAGFGGDIAYLKSIFKAIYYKEIFTDKLVFSALFSAGNITGLKGQKPLIIDKFKLGAETLRGFSLDLTKNGLGPLDKNTKDSLGGENMVRASIQLDYPILGVNDLSLTGHIFNDWGTVTDFQKYSDRIDTGKIRSSIGFGVTWRSPIGVLSVDFGFPIIKSKDDEKQVFLFSIGARF